jgi:ADP-heptose:LPS heptosyltransferase
MRILLVRLRQIGDVVFTTPALGALRTRFPAAVVTYLVEPAAAPVLAGHPHIDELIVAPNGRGLAGLGAEGALIRRLRAARFDLAVDFHGDPRASLLTWLSGAKTRIGYNVMGRGWMYTTRIDRPLALRPRHSVENQWDLLTPLGIAPPSRETAPVTMFPTPEAIRSVQERLSAAGVTREDRLIVIHLSAGNRFRRWPAPAFVTLVCRLAAGQAQRRIIVTAGPSDHEVASDVMTAARQQLPEPDRRRIVACGEFSLAELRALFDRAALFIGGDSGPLHVAATSQVPIVGLYGPTLPARSAPWRADRWTTRAVEIDGLSCRPCNQRVCEPGDFRCLAWIRPDEVIDAAEDALARAPSDRAQSDRSRPSAHPD